MSWGTSATSNISHGCRRSRLNIQPRRVGRWNDIFRAERFGWCVLISSPTSGRPLQGRRSRSKPGWPKSNNGALCASIWSCERMTKGCWLRLKPTGSTSIGKADGPCEFRMICERLSIYCAGSAALAIGKKGHRVPWNSRTDYGKNGLHRMAFKSEDRRQTDGVRN